jgi:hypothetical protein
LLCLALLLALPNDMFLRMRWFQICGLFFLGVFGLGVVLGILVGNSLASDWRTASRASIGIAPDPATTPEAVIQVYAARAFSWRGRFGVHCWVAVKHSAAEAFEVLEVIGWRVRGGMPSVAISERPPDGRWFGNPPEVLAEVRGNGVDAMIDRIKAAIETYSYPDTYRVWPGPNSNTFVAHLARAVPELRLDLPPTAIGKDYIPGGLPFGRAPSGTGFQISFLGLLGVMLAAEEGIEINILGLTFGVDPLDLAVKLPMVGRLSVSGN